MSKIILLETSTALCSAAIAQDGRIISYRQSNEPRAHASKTALFIKEMLDELGIKVQDCDAVCVSSGPGSYTGLRVGSSTAKGLCFGAGIPLIAISTMDVLVSQAINNGYATECKYIVPMVDARRMEVYCSIYSGEGKRLTETTPQIIDGDSFSEYRKEKILFIGDGALKCRDIIREGIFIGENPSAKGLADPAFIAYNEKRFENTAYFEPFYLKEFVATTSKKKLF